MSDEKKIEEQDLAKALSTLHDLAKGHSSRGTATTAVDSMSSESGATQVFHTPSDSDPGTWAGSTGYDCPENGATDAIQQDGTDYKGGAQMVKSIMEKLSKGQQLTPEEYGFMEKAMPAFMKKDMDKKKYGKKYDKDMDKGYDNDKDMDKKYGKKYDKDMDKGYGKAHDEDENDVNKSLADEASANETVAQGMEISDFLAEFVGTFNKSLANMENRIRADFQARIADFDNRQEEFGKSLAGALGTISEGLVAQTQRVDQIETTPARGPKSQQVPEPVTKSFTGPGGEPMSKALVAATMVDMVEQSKLDPQVVIRFESNGGQLDENTMARVVAHRAGR